jgi:hypothetical protein
MTTVGSPIGWVVNRRLTRSFPAGIGLVRPQVTAHIALRQSHWRDEDSRMVDAVSTRIRSRGTHQETWDRDDTAAERRWENEGGRLSVVDRPVQDFAAPPEPQQPQMSRS